MGVKKNFVYSSILTVSGYIFPLITYPYVSRVLGVTNIGICNFVDSIIHYFILLSMMGVGAVGIREIAASMTNPEKQGRVFSSLFLLNAIATLVMLVGLLVAIYVVPELYEYRNLMYVGAMKLVANLFLVEWFFKGTENFKYITNRTILVRCLYVISVFIFVKEADDYPIYFLLLSLMIVVNAAINFPYACTKVQFTLNGLMLKSYFKPFMIMGCYALLTSMYTSFNVAYLGFVSSPEQVGYYTTATKIFTIILGVYSAFTGVMMPRMSALYAEGNIDEFKRLINKSISLLFSIAIPAVIFTVIFAPEIIRFISGEGYEGAYLPARIIMPLILIIGYEQILIIQILMPTKQDKLVLRNSIFGALVGIVANLVLVTKYESVGSSIVWVACEFVILFSALAAVKKHISYSYCIELLLRQLKLYIPIIIALILFSFYFNFDYFLILVLGAIMMTLYVLFVQICIEKNQVLISLWSKVFYKKSE